jgi:cytochrome P450
MLENVHGMNTARWHEFLVYCLNRPLAYAILELSRRLGDVVHIPSIGYIVNDAEVAREVLTDRTHFDSHSPGSLGVLITQVLGPHALLNMDGAEHKELKRRLMEVFSPRYVATLLDAATADLVEDFMGALVAGHRVDVVEFLKNFASRLACELIGVKIEPRDERRAYAEMFDLATKFTALAGLGKRQLGPHELTKAKDIVARLAAHIRASYEDVQQRDHSLTQQMRARDFSFDEVQGVVIIVMIGATELITYGLPRVLALLIDSGQITKLRANPSLLDAAIDEGFRLVTPSNVILRAVVADSVVRGHRFRSGERALIVFHSIMRQARHFPDPRRFDIERPSDPRYRRLMFGAGPHACLGTGLAIAEARKVLATVLALDGELEITERRYNRGKTYPGYASLRLRLTRRTQMPRSGQGPRMASGKRG